MNEFLNYEAKCQLIINEVKEGGGAWELRKLWNQRRKLSSRANDFGEEELWIWRISRLLIRFAALPSTRITGFLLTNNDYRSIPWEIVAILDSSIEMMFSSPLSCFAIGTKDGFKIFDCDTGRLLYERGIRLSYLLLLLLLLLWNGMMFPDSFQECVWINFFVEEGIFFVR